ncbi:S49 family peptidase [Roseibium sp. CAU 1637]|uniref:S49 family peptidase n=1 Tax=Roseibium limicola TaxID=2816037 RepID=A0A939J5L6_9HYPH|nr:S49 family peptidase [Roseibium limicola]
MLKQIQKIIPKKFRKDTLSIPVVRLQGAIGMSSGPMRQGLNLASVAQSLDRAFSMKAAPAVALIVNSPGGSPVQSRLIFKRIRDLAKEKEKDVLVFVEDVAASGGYMIAVAGDEIFVDPSSIVGSIGVVSAGFGFPELLKKAGIERRVYTAGENKAILDPFQPEKPDDIAYLKSLQLEIHEVFRDLVKERRGDVLADDPSLFTGRFWTGRAARDLGLVDGIGDLREVLKERYGAKAEAKLISPPRGLFGRRTSGVGVSALSGHNDVSALGQDIGAGVVGASLAAVEERSLWARYGL